MGLLSSSGDEHPLVRALSEELENLREEQLRGVRFGQRPEENAVFIEYPHGRYRSRLLHQPAKIVDLSSVIGLSFGFDWGVDTTSSRNLTSAIIGQHLMHAPAIDAAARSNLERQFHHKITTRLTYEGWTLTRAFITEWVDHHLKERHA